MKDHLPAGPRVIPAKLFDALKASVEQWGVGSGRMYRDEGIPCCIHGHAEICGQAIGDPDARRRLTFLGLGMGDNDLILHDWRAEKLIESGLLPSRPWARMGWDEYRQRARLERGE